MTLIEVIKKLQLLTRDENMHAWDTPLQELSDKLMSEKFNLVLAGLFKRGKSSLINGLLKKNIAPVAVTPVTAVVTFFDYAELPYAVVYFENDTTLEIDTRDISQYVSEEENPVNEKKVSFVKVYANADLLKKTSIIDTPGLGSAFEHNTDTTMRFVPNIDAAVFVLSADIPVSKMDLDLLSSIRKISPAILFVQNKADLLEETDLKKVVEHNKKIISGKMSVSPDSIDICIISSKPDNFYNTGLSKLQENILQLVASEKQSLIKKNVSNRLNNILGSIQLELQLRIDVSGMPVILILMYILHFI
ncbi:MAG: hypothetical protein NVS3B19_19500 [Ginsengibacter sp.]